MPSPSDAQPTYSIGEYLRARRAAAGLSLDELALRLETSPPVCARERAELLGEVEAGTAQISLTDAAVIDDAINIDLLTFAWLSAAPPSPSENDQ
ncbi:MULTISPECIES: helix-turn-helix transcriptional regulator [unclassified Sphingomonas]|uniref:helix-turn-helix domain-containing protein n=1 Tax=unclassified Sphingomonas TaxID=196159 RepID=UPI00226A55C1|nr:MULTISPECIES: helix-turn-helix transcriptional regulator [unclassified Sphingomonas]